MKNVIWILGIVVLSTIVYGLTPQGSFNMRNTYGITNATMLTVNGIGVCLENGTACPTSSGVPGGSNTFVQFNDNGFFNGSTGFVFNKQNASVGLNGTLSAKNLTGNLSWNQLYRYPSACASGSYISLLDDAVTCTQAAAGNDDGLIQVFNSATNGFKSSSSFFINTATNDLIMGDASTPGEYFYWHHTGPFTFDILSDEPGYLVRSNVQFDWNKTSNFNVGLNAQKVNTSATTFSTSQNISRINSSCMKISQSPTVFLALGTC
jgi:hypothetical protein